MNENNMQLSKSNEKLMVVYNQIKDRLSKMKEITEQPFKTNGNFSFQAATHSANMIDIHKLTDLSFLINIHAFIMDKSESYDKSAKKLNLTEYPIFKWNNYDYESWHNDIQIRAKMITYETEKRSLEEAKRKLEPFLTHDQQIEDILRSLNLNLQ